MIRDLLIIHSFSFELSFVSSSLILVSRHLPALLKIPKIKYIDLIGRENTKNLCWIMQTQDMKWPKLWYPQIKCVYSMNIKPWHLRKEIIINFELIIIQLYIVLVRELYVIYMNLYNMCMYTM